MSFKTYHDVPLEANPEGVAIEFLLTLRKQARLRKDKHGYYACTQSIHALIKLYKKNHGQEIKDRKE